MTSTAEIQVPPTHSTASMVRANASAVPAILVTSQVPLLWLHFHDLWGREHYQFYPLHLLGVAVLLWQRWPREETTNVPEKCRAANAFLLTGLLVLTFGTLIFSHFFAAIALVVTVGALIRRFAGSRGARQLFPIWLLLWLVVPPPLGMDFRLITWLQTFTSVSSSLVLEVLGVNHFMQGNLLELPGRLLMVEQACSGVQSLFALLSFTALFVVWTRQPLIHSLLLLSSSVFWAGLGNVSRVVIIVLVHQHSGADLSAGWHHQALGLVEFTVALLMVYSTDQLLHFLLAPLGRLSPVESEQSPLSRLWNRLFQIPSEAAGTREPVNASLASLRRSNAWDACVSRGVALVFVLLGVCQLATLIADRSDPLSADRAAIAIDQSIFPARTQDWTQLDFSATHREYSSSWGEFSKTWTYDSDIGPAIVSCDYPFKGWHDLSSCYRGHGWNVTGREIAAKSEPSGPQFVQIQMRKPTGEYGFLLFGLFDATGRDLTPEGGEASLVTRVVSGVIHGIEKGPVGAMLGSRISRFSTASYQFQMLVTSEEPLSPDARGRVREQFAEFRRQLRQHWQTAANSADPTAAD